MVICEPVALYMSRVRMVAGAASPIRISTGTTVQATSSKVLWLQVAATAPFDLRKRTIEMNIAPNTRMPSTTHTHSAAMCRFQICCEIGVTPLSRLSCHGRGSAAAAMETSRAPKAAHAPTIRRLQLLRLIVIALLGRFEQPDTPNSDLCNTQSPQPLPARCFAPG